MSRRVPVDGAFEAYQAKRAGSATRTPARTARRDTRPRPRRASETRRTMPAPARRVTPDRRARRASSGRPTPAHVLRRRLIAVPIVAVLCFVAVTVKLVDVQVRNPDRLLAKGEQQRISTRQLLAGRGAILDRDGHPLALSVPRRTVFADPSMIDDPAEVADRLAPVLGLAAPSLEVEMSRSGRYVVLARTVPDTVADEVERLAIPGIGLDQEYLRVRPSDDLARAVVGSVATDGTGIAGLELQYDDLLTGTPGQMTYERAQVVGGGSITGGAREVDPASPGADLTLTLDLTLQFEAEQILAEHLDRAGADGGIAVVTRPSTGEILALANLEAGDGGYVPTSDNVALTSVYEPGSVNKVITVAAALEEGLVSPETTMAVPDELQVSDHLFTDSHEHPTTDWSVTDVVATSSNVGTIMLAQELGGETVDAYLRRFGFGHPTGLDFPSESEGIMLPTEAWAEQGTAIGSIPIGQGVSVTAVQMLQAFNVLANDGTMVPARLVRSITGSDGEVEEASVGEPERIVSAETAAQMRAMMAQVVQRGTGQQAAVPGYTIAGKTGTARKPQPGGGYQDENGRMHYVATFVGMLPAENPDLSIIVVVDEPDPDRSIYAADVAAPAFADLARVSLRHLGIPPSAGGAVAEVPEVSESARDLTDEQVPASGTREEEPVEGDGDAAGADVDG